MIKAIIFDCFGVVLTDGLRENYIYFGGDFDKDRERVVEILHEASAGRIESSAPGIANLLNIPVDEWRKRNDDGHRIDYDVLAYAEELGKQYKVAMLSNIGKGGVGRFFEPGLLEQYFEPVVESAQIGYAKPEPNAYEITADKLGVRCDECVFIDDRLEYIEGAVAVGMNGILYQNLKQLKEELAKVLSRKDTE